MLVVSRPGLNLSSNLWGRRATECTGRHPTTTEMGKIENEKEERRSLRDHGGHHGRLGFALCMAMLVGQLTWAKPGNVQDDPLSQDVTDNVGEGSESESKVKVHERENASDKVPSGAISSSERGMDELASHENLEKFPLKFGAEHFDAERTVAVDGSWPVRVVPQLSSRGSKINKLTSLTTDRIRDAVLRKEIARRNHFLLRDGSPMSPTKCARSTEAGKIICETAPWKAAATVKTKRESVSVVGGKVVTATYVGVEYDPPQSDGDFLPGEVPLVPNKEFQGRRIPILEGSRGLFVCKHVGGSLMFFPSPVDDVPEFAAGPWSVAVMVTIRPNPLKKFSSEVRLQVVDNVRVIENLEHQSFVLPDVLKTPNDVAVFSLASDQCRSGEYCTLERGPETWGRGSDVKLSCNVWKKTKVSRRVLGASIGLAKGLALTAGITYLASRLKARGQRRRGDAGEETIAQSLKNSATAAKATLLAALALGGVGIISAVIAAGLKTARKRRAVKQAIQPTLDSLTPWNIQDPTKTGSTSLFSEAGFLRGISL